VLCVGITIAYQTAITLTDVFRLPLSVAVISQFSSEAFAGLLPIWGFAEWRAKRIKTAPSMRVYFTFIPIFIIAYRLAETGLARYWLAHFYAQKLPDYLSLLAWLIASLIAAVVGVTFFRNRPHSATKLHDHF
jgi:hypothetical protein